jgi:hypothetical protein
MNEDENARAHRKTRPTIERLLRQANWASEQFDKVKEEMTGPLAILEAGKRCVDMAMKLQEFERNESGDTDTVDKIEVSFNWGGDDETKEDEPPMEAGV